MAGTPIVSTELQWRRFVEKRLGWLERRPGTGTRGDRLVGEIIVFAGDAVAPPPGWLACLGQFVLQSQYPDLYAVIGATYIGAATPIAGQFRVPDLATRVPIGAGGSWPRGTYGGAATHTLTIPEMPSHAHTQNLGTAATTASPAAGSGVIGTTNTSTTQSTGGGGAHNNMQPFVAVNYLIRT